MWHAIAERLRCTVREAQARCSSRDFAEYCALYRIDPWGELRDDLRSGIVAMSACGFKKSPSELMPYLRDLVKQPEQTTEEMRQQFEAFVRACNGR